MNIGPETASWIGQSRAIAHLVSYQLPCKPSSRWSYAASCSHPTTSLLWECCTCCTARSSACLASSPCQINIRKQWHACIPPQNILSCLNYHIPVLLLHILKGARTKVLLKAARNATHSPLHTSAPAGWESGRIWGCGLCFAD